MERMLVTRMLNEHILVSKNCNQTHGTSDIGDLVRRERYLNNLIPGERDNAARRKQTLGIMCAAQDLQKNGYGGGCESSSIDGEEEVGKILRATINTI